MAIRRALDEAKCDVRDVDAFAYTRGPGFRSCLSVCSNAAKALSASLGRPSIGVHHMVRRPLLVRRRDAHLVEEQQAHALTPLLTEERPPTFPFLTLLVSGGHTLLLLARSVSHFEILADTRDEAVGCAHLPLDLAISLILRAQQHDRPGSEDPRARLASRRPRRGTRGARPKLPSRRRQDPASATDGPAVRLLLLRPVCRFRTVGTYNVAGRGREEPARSRERPHRRKGRVLGQGAGAEGGQGDGVGRERRGRQQLDPPSTVRLLRLQRAMSTSRRLLTLSDSLADMLEAKNDEARLVFPPVELCTDNAAMIAWVGQLKLSRRLVTPYSAPTMAKWSIERCEDLDVVMHA